MDRKFDRTSKSQQSIATLKKNMEQDTHALEVVCKHFRNECGNKTLTDLRRRLNNAHVSNHRLRKKAQRLEEQVKLERSARAILNQVVSALILRMDSLLDSVQDRIVDE